MRMKKIFLFLAFAIQFGCAKKEQFVARDLYEFNKSKGVLFQVLILTIFTIVMLTLL